MKSIALYKVEDKLYPEVDVAGLHGRGINIRTELGDGHEVSLRITPFHDGILTNHTVVDTTKVSFSLRIGRNKELVLQMDNEGQHGYLHIHDEKDYSKKEPLPETMLVSELISFAFERARNVLETDFGYEIIESKGFLGFASVEEVNKRGIVTDVEVSEVDLKTFESDD